MLLHLPPVHVPNFLAAQTLETKIAIGIVIAAVCLVAVGMVL